jgi:hypothetical protein
MNYIGCKVIYRLKRYTVTDYFDSVELLFLDDEFTISIHNKELVWL